VSLSLVTDSAAATQALGYAIGQATTGGLLILLRGDYGTGKTTLVQGLAEGLGCSEPPRSPSYLIVRVHVDGRYPLVHADLYRVHAQAAVEDLGLEELAGPLGVIAIEWPVAAEWLGAGYRPRLELAFSHGERQEVLSNEDETRSIVATWSEDIPPAIIAALNATHRR
jgi:tRNA threonylcarbamoyladenosine biosynthesis protein TsaE